MLKKILALDIGEKRIGAALSDSLGMLAHPLKTIPWKGIKNLVSEIQEIISEHQVVTIVVGMPYTLKGTHSKKTDEVKALIGQLQENLAVDIIEQDERLTTKMASDALQAMGKKPSKERSKIDQIAAVYILQSYLDSL